MNIIKKDNGTYLEIFYTDLSEEAKKHFDEACEDHNYDAFPITTIYFEDEDD